MKNKLFILISAIGLFLGSNAFAIPNPFIYEDDIIQSKQIAGIENAYCLYTAAGSVIANKTDAGYYLPVDQKDVKKEVNQIIKQFKKKYAKAKTAKQKANILKKITKYQKTLTSINTCVKFNVSKLACEIATNKGINQKIIGGAKCENQKKSSVAKIVINFENTKDSDLCTGTLIRNDVILTAAHCFGQVQMASNNEKVIGKIIKNIKVTIAGKTFTINSDQSAWLVNPWWSGIDAFADTALIFLPRTVNKTPFKLIKKNYEPSQGDFAALIGYGTTKFKNNNTPVNGYAGGFATLSYVDYDMLITSYVSGTKLATTCFGDSGGPLISWVDGAWRILGTSTGGDDATGQCGTKSGVQNAYWSRINSPENYAFLENTIPGIFEE